MKLRQTEAGFTAAVIQFAQLCGWRAAHFRPARTAKGWRTAVAGDGAGFPDLVLIRGNVLVVAELKCGTNRPTPEQSAWLAAFRSAGIRAYVWYPTDWPTIEDVLRN